MHAIRYVVPVFSRSSISLSNITLWLALILLGGVMIKIPRIRRTFTIPVLRPALDWGIFSLICWMAAIFVSLLRSDLGVPWQDQAWYWTTVISCCPLIAVLGAKRPTARVWTWFIILPLIAVLGWPAVTVLIRFPEVTPLDIQLPVFIGFGLVIVMGAGNYLGSRYGLSTALSSAALLICLCPSSNLFQGDLEQATLWRGVAALLMGLSLFHAIRQANRPAVDENRFDQLWFDFRDAFGIVWSIRIQDRINQTAEREKWIVRLGTEGFIWEQNVPDDVYSETVQRLTQTLHWLLRRFVDPEWVKSRLVNVPAQLGQNPGTHHA